MDDAAFAGQPDTDSSDDEAYPVSSIVTLLSIHLPLLMTVNNSFAVAQVSR